jgi:hypothetical protein
VSVLLTPAQVEKALKTLGRYRVGRAHEVAAQRNDGLGGHHFLAVGMREIGVAYTHWNIEGGARWDGSRWVKETDPTRMDVSAFQISRLHHPAALKAMKAVRVGTWEPPVEGKTAYDGGYAPRWKEQLAFVDAEFERAVAYAVRIGVPAADRVHFVFAAHNGGLGGAESGWRDGDIDKYTAYGDYGEVCLIYARMIKRWVDAHPAWRRSR